MKIQENMTYKWIFAILKILKTSVSAVTRIGKSFVIKGILNRKFGSGRPRASKIKHNHRLKMTILNCMRKCILSTSKIQKSKKKFFCQIEKIQKNEKKWEFYQKYVEKKVSFKTVILSLQFSFIVEPLGQPEQTFLFNVPLITNVCPILFTAERIVFTFFYFKIPLVSHTLLSFSCNFIFT